MILRNLERRVKKVLPLHDPSIERLAAAHQSSGCSFLVGAQHAVPGADAWRDAAHS